MFEIIRRNKTGKWSNVAGILAIIWMCIIFSFSAQTKEESSEVSEGFSYRIVNTTGLFFHWDIDEETLQEIARVIEHSVRKGAHMTEFAIFAILLYLWTGRWNMARLRRGCAAAVMAALYAGSDELHQRFVAGRAGCFEDVLIDCSGVVLGLAFFLLAEHIAMVVYRRRKARKQREA
ncbi:MAG: VanZ family protein [Eubacterium sp.]|nr:VanZ family protein [Eubacterium sp.]